jgi:hypothetical protein
MNLRLRVDVEGGRTMRDSSLRRYVVSGEFVVEGYSPELAMATVTSFVGPRHRRGYLLPTGAIVTIGVVSVREVGPAEAHDEEVIPSPTDTAWRGRKYFMDDERTR